ncbi:hypothetical protein DW083_14120 [Parabacteroides sp. AF48-14]|nr:hypothetical protein DW083_14120 [Parabacteroides sp. AF48-14]
MIIPTAWNKSSIGMKQKFHEHGTKVSRAWNKSFTSMEQKFHGHETKVSPGRKRETKRERK